ncbi:unnamed protein product [Rotaria sordida]|uniref:Uncharacterized protein n=1 Tax=Rotaria sordida TaxID=392033 RepID=A0A820EPT8_9BILA|nr:unnamed protein product [Rotaria sordida]
MNCLLLFIFISLLTITKGAYNPIPIGSVIISTINKIFVMQPNEYGGNDHLLTVFTATPNMTIVNTIYDPILRNLYILFTNETNGTIYLCQLIANEQLDSTIYSLPITFDISNSNKLTSFSSDVNNRLNLNMLKFGGIISET